MNTKVNMPEQSTMLCNCFTFGPHRELQQGVVNVKSRRPPIAGSMEDFVRDKKR